jgi:hypothetical protein
MKHQAILTFPGGSKSKVNKAGIAIAESNESPENLKVFEDWRAAHRGVLNTFQAILRTRAKNKNVIVAQRHKRKATILDKLHRHKGRRCNKLSVNSVEPRRDVGSSLSGDGA